MLDYNQFASCIKEIIQTSHEHNDGWELFTSNDNISYMRKLFLRPLENTESSKSASRTVEQDFLFEDDSISDELMVGQLPNQQIIKWEYSIAYHESYQVPIMCLNAWTSYGHLLTLQEIWEQLKCDQLNIHLYSMITQMDHPVNKTPYYVLHPCKTAEMLSSINGKSENWVVTWLSAVAPYVQLKFPHSIYYPCTKPKKSKEGG